jgi:uncharacterized membrane protein YfcA
MSALGWIIVMTVVAIGALVQGSLGFGLNLLSAPIVALVDRRFIPGPMLVAAVIMTILILIRDRAHVDISVLKWAYIGRIPGSAVGAAIVKYVSERTLTSVFAVVVLLDVVMSAVGRRFRPTPTVLTSAGFASGVMGTTSSIGGPPMAMVFQDAPGAQMRATLSAFFVFGALLSIVLLTIAGKFGFRQLRDGLSLAPALVAGFLASRKTAQALDRGYTRAAVLVVSALGGVLVLVRALTQ